MKAKKKLKKYGEVWIKIRNLIISITKKLDDYHEKCIKIKFKLDDKLPLNKTIEIPVVVIVARANVIHKFF